MTAARSAWLWVDDDTPPPAQLAAFAAARGVRDVFVSVPWQGPDAATRRHVAALTARGIPCACLGGDADWATDPLKAVGWMRRATAAGPSGAVLFRAVHLDIEPWTREDWATRAVPLLDGLVRAVRAVSRATPLPVEVDLPGWLARDHPAHFRAAAAAAARLTIMAYRDRATGILREADAARRLAGQRPTRIGVDTRAADDARTTFFDDGAAVLDRETRAVAALARADARFAGIAVHDLTGWWALRA